MSREDKHKKIEILMNNYDFLHLTESDDERINQRKYQHAIKSLIYAVIHTRSDIIFAVDRLSQYLSDSIKHHDQALKTLIRYIRSIINLSIIYKSSKSTLLRYSNSDYAADIQERKSTYTCTQKT